MKPTIIAIVGPSGSGKTTMANHLRHVFGIPTVVSCTNRPMREGEINGYDHYFYTDDELPIVMPGRDEMLAYTKFGGYHYWASVAQVQNNEYISYVIDEKGLIEMIERFDDEFNIVSILIKRDCAILESSIDKARLQRDKHRIKIEDNGYTAIIQNNGSITEFYQNIEQTIKSIL